MNENTWKIDFEYLKAFEWRLENGERILEINSLITS